MVDYTPGPWEAGRLVIIKSTGEGYNFSVGDCHIFPPTGEAGPVAIAAGEANARLIAAAPDMLAALRDTLGGLDAEFGARVTDVNFPKLRAALRKAAP